MNIYIYSDESGVFDKYHNDIFVFGGIIFLDKDSKEKAERKYVAMERNIRKRGYSPEIELKASILDNSDKNSIFRSLNDYYKFGVVIDQKRIYETIFANKKAKQRYLDYAYKIAVKKYLEYLIKSTIISKNESINMYFFVDEHNTATNGLYELREALEEEFKHGTYNIDFSAYYPPLFNNLGELNLRYCNSASKTLVRASDIIANHIYYRANKKDVSLFRKSDKFHVIKLP